MYPRRGPTYSEGTLRASATMIPRILIIDDEADIREVTALSLETVAGWQVIVAPSGAQGIRRASLEQPDAILLDVMMPDIDGPTTFQILKQNGTTAHIPVLLLTAKVQGQDRRKLDELGAAAILSKPFDPLTLADQISDVLGWPRDGIAKTAPADAVSSAVADAARIH
jgi:CheY-like chemotaxis protein